MLQQNVNFNIQPPAIFVFLLSPRKSGLVKIFHPLWINQHSKVHGPALTGASFVFTSEV
jgi:hypothetical protein